ncbi:MAG: B12-binding domain-containing radical SAM protein [Candidatus Omnitrophica bacterium]|nr:B12-binding domain-containing radical SAM protein [Candidatus Omnitrophota bacterium]MBU1127564.1 B12-binding domain-containing radical SAM protein [Candidatus Omnitrophota bacterium]MBU1852400.1 B12-binding domain-containing radical SAM protein [Candidatus Omnitrophota bacterium]
MCFHRILLITPPVKTELGPVRPNIGLGYLAQMLLENGIKYDVLDMLLGYTLDDLKRKVDQFKPDLLGVNLFSNKYKTAYETIEEIKKYFPSMKVIVGGPHVSCLRKKVLEDCPSIDFGVFLEGEFALLELCRGKKLKDIENLIYREDGDIVENKTRKFIQDLDALNFPTYNNFELNRYIDEKAVISSRGCPYSCTYCAVKLASGQQVRLRSPENVVDEVEFWHKRGYRQFSFQDDNFNVSKDRVFKICDEIEKRGFKDIFFRCAGARADKLDRDVLGRMKEVGFRTIAIGVEVGNDKMLGVIKKGEKFSDIDNAVKNACEVGFDVYLNFLAGVPYETISDIQDSINFSLKYPVFYAEWSNIIPYPGTELYDWLSEKGYLFKQPDEYLNDNSTTSNIPVFETPELSLEMRKKILVMVKKVRKKILRRSIVRRLEQRGIPWGIKHGIGFVVSTDTFMKYLFQNKIRGLADLIRFRLYMRGKDK